LIQICTCFIKKNYKKKNKSSFSFFRKEKEKTTFERFFDIST